MAGLTDTQARACVFSDGSSAHWTNLGTILPTNIGGLGRLPLSNRASLHSTDLSGLLIVTSMAAGSSLGSRQLAGFSGRQRLYSRPMGQREATGCKPGGHGEDEGEHGEKQKGKRGWCGGMRG